AGATVLGDGMCIAYPSFTKPQQAIKQSKFFSALASNGLSKTVLVEQKHFSLFLQTSPFLD
ncbi:MAG: hypothetical protein RSB25_06205, partial [Acinetobacter sp.]